MNFPKKRFTHVVSFRSNYFSLLMVIFGSILLSQESQSAPIENTDIFFIKNVLDDLNFWHSPASIEEFVIDTHNNNVVDFSVDNDLPEKDKTISKPAQEVATTSFKTSDKNHLSDQNIPCIFCKNIRSVGSNSFALASSVPLRELNVNDEYPIFEAVNDMHAVVYIPPILIEIGFFEILAMIGFGFFIGILKFLRLNHFAMSEVYSRNGEIVGAPMRASPLGTGFVATNPQKNVHRTPLFIPRMPVPGSVEISHRW